MTLFAVAAFAVAAPIHQHAEIATTTFSTGVAPVTVYNYLGGATILTLLAVMIATGFSAAGMRGKAIKQSRAVNVGIGHPIH